VEAPRVIQETLPTRELGVNQANFASSGTQFTQTSQFSSTTQQFGGSTGLSSGSGLGTGKSNLGSELSKDEAKLKQFESSNLSSGSSSSLRSDTYPTSH
jgi:hypothetical protein